MANFPVLEAHNRLKTEQRPTSRSIVVQKHRTVTVNAELKSKEQKKVQEDTKFQKAMEKISKIMKARGKAIERMKKTS